MSVLFNSRSVRPLSLTEAEELAGLVEVARNFDAQVREVFAGIPSEIATHLLRVARKLAWKQFFSATIVPQPRKEWLEPQEYTITLSASGVSVLEGFENLFKEFTPCPSGLYLKGILLQSEHLPPTRFYHCLAHSDILLDKCYNITCCFGTKGLELHRALARPINATLEPSDGL